MFQFCYITLCCLTAERSLRLVGTCMGPLKVTRYMSGGRLKVGGQLPQWASCNKATATLTSHLLSWHFIFSFYKPTCLSVCKALCGCVHVWKRERSGVTASTLSRIGKIRHSHQKRKKKQKQYDASLQTGRKWKKKTFSTSQWLCKGQRKDLTFCRRCCPAVTVWEAQAA